MGNNITEKQKQAIEELKNKLDYFKNKLEGCDYSHEQEKFFTIMQEFWRFISKFNNQNVLDVFQHSEYYAKNKMFFSALEHYYIRTLESVESIGILTKKVGNLKFSDTLDRQYAKEVYSQTHKEIQLLDLKNTKTLVMVGCGPMPETILYIYENTDIENIIGIDNNQEAVYIASELIRSQGLKRIKLIHYNGMQYDYKDADIIYVANFSVSKKEIFERIADTAKDGVQILTRTPVLFGKMLYEDALQALPLRLSVIKEGEISRYFLFKPLLIKKLAI